MDNKWSQEERIEKFYEVLLSQSSDASLNDMFSYLLLGIGMISVFIPAQEIFFNKDDASLMWTFVIWIAFGVHLYMNKYFTYTNGKISETIREQLLYMPIDGKLYRKFLFSRLTAFLNKISIVAFVIQIFMAILVEHSISIWNVLYVGLLTFLLPFLFCSITIICGKGK